MIKADFEFCQNLENFKFDFKIIKQKITENVRYWIKLVRSGPRSCLIPWEKPELNELKFIQFVLIRTRVLTIILDDTKPVPKWARYRP